MNTCRKLIEVAMPIKESRAEGVRDKFIRHGHISTLHLWCEYSGDVDPTLLS